jgi:hypothetical protein
MDEKIVSDMRAAVMESAVLSDVLSYVMFTVEENNCYDKARVSDMLYVLKKFSAGVTWQLRKIEESLKNI